MKIVVENCVLASFNDGEFGQSIKIIEGTGEIRLKAGSVDLSQLPLIVPVRIEAEVSGYVSNGKTSLKLVSLTAKKLIEGSAK